MTAPPLTISVVVCAYTEERWDALVEAVASLRAQSLPPAEIILVVDHNPALLERARRLPELLVLANREGRGLSGARNTGLRAASGAVVAFMDEDAAASPTWLEELAACYADKRVVAAGGAILPRWQSGRPDWFPEEFDWVVGCSYRGMPRVAGPVRNLIGCNMSFRRAALLAVGGFRHGIGRVGKRPVGCEETELCIRVGQRWPDAEIRYQPLATVAHRVPPERARWAYFRARCYGEGISKAAVSRLVGRRSALASEGAYATRTLPRAVARELAAGGRPGLRRAAALVAGLLITAAGYVAGNLLPAEAAPAGPAAPPAEMQRNWR